MIVETQDSPVRAERPRKLTDVTVDVKGRLKLPSNFQDFFRTSETKDFFITTTDKKSVYIFPLEQWKKWEERMTRPVNADEVELFEVLSFISKKFGDDASVDKDGRLLLPKMLRDHFKMNDTKVWLECKDDSIRVLNEEQYLALELAADEDKLKRANALMKLMGGKF